MTYYSDAVIPECAQTTSGRVRALRTQADTRNYYCNLADGTLSAVALTLASQDFLLPAFLREVGASGTVVGFVLSAPQLLTFYIPLLAAPFVARMAYKKPFVLFAGALQRLPFLLLAISAFWLAPRYPTATIWVVAAIWTVKTLANMLVIPAWGALMAKVTPLQWRGSLFAWRWNLAFIPILASWWLIRWVMRSFQFPTNYALIFSAAAAFFWLSIIFLAMVREPKGEVCQTEKKGNAFKQVPALFREDRNFRRLMASMFPYSIGFGMVHIFFILTAAERLAMPTGEVAAKFMLVSLASTFVGGIVFGRIGDRTGHKLNYMMKMPLAIGACVLSIFATTLPAFAAVFIITGLLRAINSTSGLTLIMEFGQESNRAQYMAVYNTLFLPTQMAAPMLGGFLRDIVGADQTYAISIGMLALAGLLALQVKDPRRPDSRTSHA